MKETFEEYLMGKCMEDTHALDDMLPDVYEDWIGEQDVEDIIEWAEKWNKEQLARQFKEMVSDVVPNLDEIQEDTTSMEEKLEALDDKRN